MEESTRSKYLMDSRIRGNDRGQVKSCPYNISDCF